MEKPMRKPFTRNPSLGDYRRYTRKQWNLSWRVARICMQTEKDPWGCEFHPLTWKACLIYDQRKSLDALLIPASGRLIGKGIVDMVLAERAQEGELRP